MLWGGLRQAMFPAGRRVISANGQNGDGINARDGSKDHPPQHSTHLALPRNDKAITMQRRIWVKRPGASATRVAVDEEDLVDNVRDVILHKYANSLGRNIDSPDINLKIVSREPTNNAVKSERVLGPEEPIGQTLDTYYPGGQDIEEALIIEIPDRRTPRPSPRVESHNVPYYISEIRPGEGAREYFPPMAAMQSPRIAGHVAHPNDPRHPSVHSIAVLNTGQLPPLPSPGSHPSRRSARPRMGRQHTSSPTILHTVQPNGILDSKQQHLNGVTPVVPPLPTPPASQVEKTITPPNRATSPHGTQRPRRTRKNPSQAAAPNMHTAANAPPKLASAGLLNGTVPPINVLIVEDNVINLRLLEAFMKRLKVRWKSAMNGKEAVDMWRKGGYHLVLMDIQLPIMNGLEATKEIRRLEGVNGIGVFSGSPVEHGQKGALASGAWATPSKDDKLPDRSLFMSPVIIVALTASSLQSDRHEALAAGCNDFLTKPVNFVWMERKVTEWGCMQALIDYEGWRNWKDYAKKLAEQPKDEAAEKAEKKRKMAEMKAHFSRPPPKFDATKPAETKPPNTVDTETAKAEATANVTASAQFTNSSAASSSTPAAVTTPGHANGGVKKPVGRNSKSRTSGSAGLGTTLESKEEG